MARNVVFNIPPERAEQLRQISIALGGRTIAETIGYLIRCEIEKGTIKNTIPGYDVQRISDTISIKTSAWRKEMSSDEATRLAGAVRGILTPSKSNPFLPYDGITLSRNGPAIKLRDADTGADQVIAASVAADLADVIESVATE
jgi:hypothetical protein